jgi:hypothetical protein
MPEIPREMIEHKLGIDLSYKSVKQKERRYTPESARNHPTKSQ